MKWRRLLKASGCAKRSFRVKRVSPTTLIRFCCPKKQWKSGYCTGAGVEVQAIGKKRRR